ncbi:hypothetical protein C8R44DRAFT_874862 [Mycena epipterygia]|nr:hypothetical protein C8R44DRAFT_874862 [Mycena epipterygia]
MSSDKRPLRILYSLNGSPQYILARSQGVVPIEFIPSQGDGASSSRSTVQPLPRYASASLKTCLNTICRSSPEIIQDHTRDFSVYLLDPLETDCAPAQVNISHSHSQSSLPDAPEARVAVGLGLMSWGLLADESDAMSVTGTLKVSGAGQEMLEIIFSLRETIPMQKASLPEALRSWGLPNLSNQKGKRPATYPPPKRKSRAGAIKAPLTKIPSIFESDKLLAVSKAYVGPERRPRGRPPMPLPTNEPENDDVVVVDGPTTTSPSDGRPGEDHSPILDLLALIKAISPDMERNKALGNVLGLMHGPDGTAVHPPAELADAMTLFSQLQSAPRSSQPEGSQASNSQHRRKSSSTDDEIVVLNKENVNPTNFRRRGERDREDAKLLGSVEPSGTAASAPSQIQPDASRLMPPGQPLTRKRTLSDFMEEQESVREKERAQKRGQYYRQPERSMSEDSFRDHTSTTTTTSTNNSVHPPKSSRTRTASCASSPGPSVPKELPVPVPRPRLVTSASSPARPPRKKYVVPAWARTETATQPRLSDRVTQRVQQKEQEEEKKRKELRRKQDRERILREGKQPVAERRASGTSTPVTAPGAKISLLPPVAATGEFPVFGGAVEQASQPPCIVPLVQSSSQAASQSHPPCTPPRKRRTNTIATPGGRDSLFTPASGSWEASGVLSLGRCSMSPSSRKAPTSDADQPQPSAEPESEEDGLLGQELDSAFDELDFPPSSLPIASSDIEVDVETQQLPTASQEYDSDDSDDDDPPKQHWVGLPPSSPPPPSSPYLMGAPMDDDDVEEAPLTKSEGDFPPETETLDSPDTEVINYSVEELGKLLNLDDLSNFFPSSSDNIDTANLFDQFTNHELTSDDSSQIIEDWGLNGTNPDFDFTEFWESVKPLVEGCTDPSDMNQDFNAVDPAKLAGDVHALFSGCLV